MYYCYYDSPLGKLLLAGTETNLHLIGFPSGKMHKQPLAIWQHRPHAFADCKQQLAEYFAGERQYFDINYTLSGTAFQQQALRAVAAVKYGSTASYSDIANAIANPAAVRAVGMANATNPLPIIIPCHRIIGKNGSLTGFGGGLEAKRFLLNLETAITTTMCYA